jgi:glycosyltransferase involved in cell wall biosynthesis
VPSISVVLPNFNHAHHVATALRAILHQSVRPLELIVIDDGSTDESVEVIEEVAGEDPRVQILRNDRNRGAVFSLNRGLSQAKGDFIYLAASDDRVLPGFFEESLRVLSLYPEAGASFGDLMLLDARTGRLTPNRLGLASRSGYLSPDSLFERLRLNDPIAGCSTILRREALVELGGLSEDLKWRCDWFAALTIGFRYGACYVDKPLAAYRFDPAGYSQRGVWDRRTESELLDRVIERLESSGYADVAPYFYQSGVLSRFGFRAVRLAFARRRGGADRLRVPLGRALVREIKDLLSRVAPGSLRRIFWAVRYRWQRLGRSPTRPRRRSSRR